MMKPGKASPLFVWPILAALSMLSSCRGGNPACDCPRSRFESGAYFSQLYEDYVLAYVFQDRKMGFYVDVGANDPNHDNVTKIFYERGWRGVNIEPNVGFFRELDAQRPGDRNVNAVISDAAGEVPESPFFGWESAHLCIVHRLEAMLHRPEKHIRFVE